MWLFDSLSYIRKKWHSIKFHCKFAFIESNYIFYQPNPKNYLIGDCTLRAYCKIENITWEQAFDIAAKIAKKNAVMMDDTNCVDDVLKSLHYKYIPYTEKTIIYLDELVRLVPDFKYIADADDHIIAEENGKYYDTYDSGNKKINGIYIKSKFLDKFKTKYNKYFPI